MARRARSAVRRPPLVARLLIDLAVRLVPAEVRPRYWYEFRSEAAEATRPIRCAADLLVHAPALRTSIGYREGDPLPVSFPRYRPFGCRLNWTHHWVVQRNDDGERYRRCLYCGVDNMEFGQLALDGNVDAAIIMSANRGPLGPGGF